MSSVSSCNSNDESSPNFDLEEDDRISDSSNKSNKDYEKSKQTSSLRIQIENPKNSKGKMKERNSSKEKADELKKKFDKLEEKSMKLYDKRIKMNRDLLELNNAGQYGDPHYLAEKRKLTEMIEDIDEETERINLQMKTITSELLSARDKDEIIPKLTLRNLPVYICEDGEWKSTRKVAELAGVLESRYKEFTQRKTPDGEESEYEEYSKHAEYPGDKKLYVKKKVTKEESTKRKLKPYKSIEDKLYSELGVSLWETDTDDGEEIPIPHEFNIGVNLDGDKLMFGEIAMATFTLKYFQTNIKTGKTKAIRITPDGLVANVKNGSYPISNALEILHHNLKHCTISMERDPPDVFQPWSVPALQQCAWAIGQIESLETKSNVKADADRKMRREERKKTKDISKNLSKSLRISRSRFDPPDNSSSSSSESSDSSGCEERKRNRRRKKRKEREKRKRRERSRKRSQSRRTPDNFSLTSHTSILFEMNPVEKIRKRLERIISTTSDAIKNDFDNKYYLESILRKLEKEINNSEAKIENLINLTNDEEETLDDITHQASRAENELQRLLAELAKASEQKKNLPRISFCTFEADPLTFLEFQETFDRQLQYASDPDKLTQYRKSMSGPRRAELISYIANVKNYKEARERMIKRFGNYTSSINSQLTKLAKLPTPSPNGFVVENANIEIINNFARWLKIQKKEDIFNEKLRDEMSEKLRPASQEKYFEEDFYDLDEFKCFLDNILQKNFKRIPTDQFEKKFHHDDKRRDDKRGSGQYRKEMKSSGYTNIGGGRTSTRANTITAGFKPGGVKCNLCSENDGPNDHHTDMCPRLKDKNVPEIKNILRQSRLCFICLRKLKDCTKNHIVKNKSGKTHNLACPCNCGVKFSLHKNRDGGSASGTTQGPVAGPSSSTTVSNNNTSAVVPTVNTTSRTNTLVPGGCRLIMNGSELGRPACPSQRVTIVGPDGSTAVINLLMDGGAEASLCSENLTHFFHGTLPAKYTYANCNEIREVEGNIAKILLRDDFGNDFQIEALTQPLALEILPVKEFEVPSHWITEFNAPPIMYTSGDLPYSLILGRDANKYLPKELDKFEGLSLYKSVFGGKLIIAGTDQGPSLGATTSGRRIGVHQKNDTEWLIQNSGGIDFVRVPPLCSTHQNDDCKECKNLLMKTPQERFEDNILESSLHFIPDESSETVNDDVIPPLALNELGAKDKDSLVVNKSEDVINTDDNTKVFSKTEDAFKSLPCSGHWEIRGRYRKCLEFVPDYKEETKIFQLKQEKKLVNKPIIRDGFNEAIEKRIKDGHYRTLDSVLEEFPDFLDQQIIYSPMSYAIKADSTRTKTRPVVNCSFSTSPTLGSFNQAQFKGSSLVPKIALVLLRQRQYPFIARTDLVNFYMSLSLSQRDLGLNCLWYRQGGWTGTGPLITLVCTKNNYGQVQAGNLANRGKLRTSNMFIEPISPPVHTMIKDGSYVDDIYVWSNCTATLKEYMQIAETGLSKGGFKCEPWISSGDTCTSDIDITADAEGKSLGLHWTPRSDEWRMAATVNLSSKVRGSRDISMNINTLQDAKKLFETSKISKRVLLRITHAAFDVLGFFVQLSINLKLSYRKLTQTYKTLTWDEAVPEEVLPEWLNAIKMILECREVKIPRYILSDCEKREAELIVFGDGGQYGSCSIAYARYKKTDGTFTCSYILGSTKLASPGSEIAVKTETEAILMSLRNVATIVDTLTNIEFTSIKLISDSRTCLGGVVSNSQSQRLFYQVRNFESRGIISKYGVKLYFTESQFNLADIGSKENYATNHALDPEYWSPSWLAADPSTWSVEEYVFKPDHVTEITNPKMMVMTNRITNNDENFLEKIFSKYNSFEKILTVVSFLFYWRRNISTMSEAATKAKIFLVKNQNISDKDIAVVKRNFLYKRDEDGTHYALSRSFIQDEKPVSQKLLIVASESDLAKKILFDCHRHCGNIELEIARMYQLGFYVVKHRIFLKYLAINCTKCRRMRKKAETAQLGPSRTLAAAQSGRVYATSFADMIGPVKIKKKRAGPPARGYILILTCLWSRFTSFVIMQDMTAASVLKAILIAANTAGGSVPSSLHTDRGSNFLPVQHLDTEDGENIIRDLKSQLLRHKITLKTSSAKSPWRQAVAEKLVDVFKRTLDRADLKNKSYSPMDWQFICSKMSLIINQRVLSIKYFKQSAETITALNIVYGRRDNVHPINFDLSDGSGGRLYAEVENLDKDLAQFQKCWFLVYGQESLRWEKWKHSSRELKPGDVVFILDRIIPETGNPTLGIIQEVVSTGEQRTFKVLYTKRTARVCPNSYQIIKSSKLSTFLRPKQGLVYITSSTQPDTIIDVDPLMYSDDTEPDNSDKNDEEEDDLIGVSGDVQDLPQDYGVSAEEEDDPGYQNNIPVNIQLEDIPLMSDISSQNSKQKLRVSVPGKTEKIKNLQHGIMPSNH